MRKTLTTVALLLALSCTALGGEIHIPPAPAPPQASATQETAYGVTLNGEIPNDAPVSLTQIALELLTVLPSLL
ncbi:MAG TPA: hypothetical protein VN282_20155 [Pyrinomonadaceae bacterium]|nr:hypothetical protein [Pyrinomonadaceae bacterium]